MKLNRFTFFSGLIFVSLLLISGCSTTTTNSPEEVGLVLSEENFAFYDADDFRIQYPVNWKVMRKDQLNAKYAQSAEVAFVSNFKDMFFTPVIVVEKIAIPEQKSVEDFAEESLATTKASLVSFEELERQTVSTSISNVVTTTKLLRFTAKEKLQDDTLEYLQTYLVKNANGYVVTAVYDPTNENSETTKIVDSLRTFKLK